MNDIDISIPAILDRTNTLPAMVDRAARMLASAHSAAEVLEARDMASVAYDTAKRAARMATAKDAHDELISKVTRAQADALDIEARAKRRLADEYDAAQKRGEVAGQGNIPNRNVSKLADLGISSKDIHEGRIIGDAEEADPGIVHRVIEEAVAAGEEPTRAKLKRAVLAKSKRKRHPRPVMPEESQHDRDLRMLIGVWEASCDSAKEAFLDQVTR